MTPENLFEIEIFYFQKIVVVLFKIWGFFMIATPFKSSSSRRRLFSILDLNFWRLLIGTSVFRSRLLFFGHFSKIKIELFFSFHRSHCLREIKIRISRSLFNFYRDQDPHFQKLKTLSPVKTPHSPPTPSY